MKNISVYIDIAFCIIVLPIMMMIFPIERWFHNFQWYVISVGIWLYCLYFLNRVVTVPFLFKGKKYSGVGVVAIVVSILITYGLSRVTLYTPKPMIVEAFSFAVGLLTEANIQRTRRRAVEAERDKAEIELYKAQIKPHFMFNTLNSLYGLFLTKNENALSSLEKFISMMRYIHTTSMCSMVPLVDEVDYINQYVGLQKLRLNGETSVELEIDIEDTSLMIPPMLLVTFVENCFKHGVSPVEKSQIKISMHERGGWMRFLTSNRIFPVRRIGEHMGIDNCRRRLELLYPGRHELNTLNTGTFFVVELQIDLTA